MALLSAFFFCFSESFKEHTTYRKSSAYADKKKDKRNTWLDRKKIMNTKLAGAATFQKVFFVDVHVKQKHPNIC